MAKTKKNTRNASTPNPVLVNYGAEVRRIREGRNISQIELAKMLGFGRTNTKVSNIETGSLRLNAAGYTKIKKVLDLDPPALEASGTGTRTRRGPHRAQRNRANTQARANTGAARVDVKSEIANEAFYTDLGMMRQTTQWPMFVALVEHAHAAGFVDDRFNALIRRPATKVITEVAKGSSKGANTRQQAHVN